MKYCLLLIFIILAITPCFSQVVYQGTIEQRKSGIYKTILVKTDAFSSDVVVTTDNEDKDVKVKSCVKMDGGECVESEYFKVTIKDVI